MRRLVVLLAVVLTLLVGGFEELKAQYITGTTGLMTIPTAEMHDDGHFMGGFNYMPKELLPEQWSYNTFNYFLNITFFPFLEVAFTNTVVKLGGQYEGKVNQDRSLSARFRVLKERKWVPAVVVGSNDLFTTSTEQYNPLEESDNNRYFASIYAVATKSFNFNDHGLGVSLGYNISRYSSQLGDGLFAGVCYRPPFANELQFMGEINDKKVSFGAAKMFWNHLSLNLFCYDFKAVGAGIRYEITLY